MLRQALSVLRNDLSAVIAFVAGLSQLGAAKALFDPSTSDLVVYACCAVTVAGTGYFAYMYFRSARRERFHPTQVRMFRMLASVFLFLALGGLGPALYRVLLVHTTFLTPKPDQSGPIILGGLVWLVTTPAHAATTDASISAVLDTSRTSVRCERPTLASLAPAEISAWHDCSRFSVGQSDLERFLNGWRGYSRLDEHAARLEFERRYWSKVVKPAHRAMLAIPRLASNPIVRNYEFPIHVALRYDWKQRLFTEQLVPTAAEWGKLRSDTPELASALRKYFVEIVGVLDPTFIVSIQNRAAQPIKLTSITYSATPISQAKAELLSGYERPKYVLQLQKGTHTEPMIPPVVVPANSIATFDLLITTMEPQPGMEYEVSLSLGDEGNRKLVTLPTTSFVFWRGK